VYRLLRRQHVGFERHDDIDPPLALQEGERRPIETAPICEHEITRTYHRCLLQPGTTQRHIVPRNGRQRDLAQQTRTIEPRP
jgi:hypothetical protein